jgi:hypothetical protein
VNATDELCTAYLWNRDGINGCIMQQIIKIIGIGENFLPTKISANTVVNQTMVNWNSYTANPKCILTTNRPVTRIATMSPHKRAALFQMLTYTVGGGGVRYGGVHTLS